MIWRTKMQAGVQGKGATEGFNLLQMSPNWFLQIWMLETPIQSVPKPN
jgi:hypothetical protein